MPPRANPTITLMVSQAQQKMRELKELQFFGGDSLNLKRYSYTITVPTDAVAHCWRIVMVPDDPNTTMPLDVISKPANATSFSNANIERVHRSDDSFEFLAITDAVYGGTSPQIKVVIEYAGKATFSVNQIG